MPLMKFDVIEGRTDAEIKTLLDAAHRAMVAAFKVPERDRYQILQEHKPSRMIVEDTGLGIDRTDKVVVVQVVSRPRTKEKKQALYQLMCEELEKSCGIAPSDVMVAIVENNDEDWSFGLAERNSSPATSRPRADVIAGLDPAIQGRLARSLWPWMPSSRPGMTKSR
jgi:phenylpyruvate tautomerase PptA (4-oxalocrotonate tautomerase family)